MYHSGAIPCLIQLVTSAIRASSGQRSASHSVTSDRTVVTALLKKCVWQGQLVLLQADTLSNAAPIQRIIPGSWPFGEYLDVSNTTSGLIMTR